MRRENIGLCEAVSKCYKTYGVLYPTVWGSSIQLHMQCCQHSMTTCLSLQQVLGSLLQLRGQERTSGFGTCHVTAGPTPTAGWSFSLPELPGSRSYAFQAHEIHQLWTDSQMPGPQTHLQDLKYRDSDLPLRGGAPSSSPVRG